MAWYYYAFGVGGWLLFMYQRYLANGWRKNALVWREKTEEMADAAMRAQDRCEEALKTAMEETLRRAVVEKETVILRRELCREKGIDPARLPHYLIMADARWRAEQGSQPLDKTKVRKGRLVDK